MGCAASVKSTWVARAGAKNPANLFQVLKSYLQIDPAASPEAVFQRGAEKAGQAQAQLEQASQQSPKGKRISPVLV